MCRRYRRRPGNRAGSFRGRRALAVAVVVDLDAVIAQRRLAADETVAHVARHRRDVARARIAEAAAARIDECQTVARLDQEIGLLRRQLLLVGETPVDVP